MDATLFNDPRDAEMNALMAAIPKGPRWGQAGAGAGSLGSTADERTLAALRIPGLAADLNASYAAWKDGTLERTHTGSASCEGVGVFVGRLQGMGLLLAFLTHRYLHRQKTELFQKNPYR